MRDAWKKLEFSRVSQLQAELALKRRKLFVGFGLLCAAFGAAFRTERASMWSHLQFSSTCNLMQMLSTSGVHQTATAARFLSVRPPR